MSTSIGPKENKTNSPKKRKLHIFLVQHLTKKNNSPYYDFQVHPVKPEKVHHM